MTKLFFFRFINLSNLKNHLRIHPKALPHQCDLCPLQFNQPQSLALHKEKHMGQLSHPCSKCELTFGAQEDVTHHMAASHNSSSNSRESPNESNKEEDTLLPNSDTQSSSESQKVAPIRIKKPKECHIPDLKKKKGILLNKKKFTCKKCGGSYRNKQELNFHVLKHCDNKRYQCDICQRRFLMKAHLVNHKNFHTEVGHL